MSNTNIKTLSAVEKMQATFPNCLRVQEAVATVLGTNQTTVFQIVWMHGLLARHKSTPTAFFKEVEASFSIDNMYAMMLIEHRSVLEEAYPNILGNLLDRYENGISLEIIPWLLEQPDMILIQLFVENKGQPPISTWVYGTTFYEAILKIPSACLGLAGR